MEHHCPAPTTERKPLASKGGKRARRTCETRHPRGDKDMATTKSTKHNMSKADRQQARERAQERAQAALDRLGEGVRAVYDSERWESWLRSLSRFYNYSLGNTILIAMQMPNATHVASFRSWKRDFNRYVRKGERGIEILVPMLVKCHDEEEQDEERRRLVGFRVGHVFDVSQTDGEPHVVYAPASAFLPDHACGARIAPPSEHAHLLAHDAHELAARELLGRVGGVQGEVPRLHDELHLLIVVAKLGHAEVKADGLALLRLQAHLREAHEREHRAGHMRPEEVGEEHDHVLACPHPRVLHVAIDLERTARVHLVRARPQAVNLEARIAEAVAKVVERVGRPVHVAS